ncbi:hypothetical protein BDW74DRAFT_175515 [Aspergillus multicolor]|uniref:uncharacterized protein n=1 Tax=Aspergillus multicolor TaxID=41759 RepID=UPI003CCDF81F
MSFPESSSDDAGDVQELEGPRYISSLDEKYTEILCNHVAFVIGIVRDLFPTEYLSGDADHAHGLASSGLVSSLIGLPTELLCMIFRFLAEHVYHDCDEAPNLSAGNAEHRLFQGYCDLYPGKCQLLYRTLSQTPHLTQDIEQLIFFESRRSEYEMIALIRRRHSSHRTASGEPDILFKLLMALPQLRRFWYVPLEKQGGTQAIRSAEPSSAANNVLPRFYPLFLKKMASVDLAAEPVLHDCLIGGLEDVYLHGYPDLFFMVFLSMILVLPTLCTLRLSHWPSLSRFPGVALDWTSSTVRKLFLSCRGRGQELDDVRRIIAAVRPLEVFHLEVDSRWIVHRFLPGDNDSVALRPLSQVVLDTLCQHRKTLKNLRVVGPVSLANLDFFSFENLALIDLPDSSLFNSSTTIDNLIARLSKALTHLTVDMSSGSGFTCTMMGCLAHHATRFPALKKVTLTNRDNHFSQRLGIVALPLLCAELAIATKVFEAHGVLYEYPHRFVCPICSGIDYMNIWAVGCSNRRRRITNTPRFNNEE